MMSDFKSFQKNYRAEPPQKKQAASGPHMDEQTVADFAKKYQGSGEQEVLSDLLQEARKGKENGTFDINQMEDFAGTLKNSGLFDQKQLSRLEEVMKMLKNT